MGGKVYHYTPKSKNFLKSFISMKNIVKKKKYKHVIRVSQHSLATIDLIAAKFGGASILVQRSSNTDSGGNASRVLHRIFKFLPMKVPTLKIAPSTEAAEYTFGKGCIDKGKAMLIKNAIAVDDFIFNQEKRDKIRKDFKINDKFVIGHIGRFNLQKNHSYLIDIFAEIVKEHANSILILVGKGELEGEIKNRIESFNLKNKVIFTGVRADIPDLLMAMDVFIFPSFFEGMPNTVIEAQATGLKCLISDRITREAGFTDLVEFFPLDLRPSGWAKAALRYQTGYERKNMKKKFVEKGYDIKSTVKFFEELLNSERPGYSKNDY